MVIVVENESRVVEVVPVVVLVSRLALGDVEVVVGVVVGAELPRYCGSSLKCITYN